MAIVNGYCTVAELREQLDDEYQKIPDTLIERVINATSRAIDNYCGFPRRKFWRDPVPTTRRYVPTDRDVLYVHDIADDTDVIVTTDDGAWTVSDFVLLPQDAAEYGSAYAYTHIETSGSRWFPVTRIGRPTVTITAVHGWSAVPPEVHEACIIRSVALLKRRDAPFGVAGFGEFGTSVRIRAEDPDVADLLSPLRRYGAGTV